MPLSCLELIKACWPTPLPPSVEAWIALRCDARVPHWVILFVLVDLLRKPHRSAITDRDLKRFVQLMKAIEERPQDAEALLKQSVDPFDMDQWRQLLDATTKLWPDFDGSFLFILFDTFIGGSLEPENLKPWVDAYRASHSPPSSQPS